MDTIGGIVSLNEALKDASVAATNLKNAKKSRDPDCIKKSLVAAHEQLEQALKSVAELLGRAKDPSVELCGKQGCSNAAVTNVLGSLNYATCADHYDEIAALVAGE